MIIRQEGASQRGKGVNVRVGAREGSALGKRGSDLTHTRARRRKRGSGDLAKSHPDTERVEPLGRVFGRVHLDSDVHPHLWLLRCQRGRGGEG